jgi:predicted lipoprotein with Yx(FWY)xxD motif
MQSKLLIAGAITSAMLAAACGGSNSPSAAASPSSSSAPATVAVATNSKLGQILVDGAGRTLYLFVADTGSTSTCSGGCAQYWPPLLTNGAPQAGTGANASLLSTTKRTDGTTEVTYGGHPLYYVITDHNPGDASGQAVNNYGALWYVVGPDGKQIT